VADDGDVQRELIQAAIAGNASPWADSAGALVESLFSDGTEKKVLVSVAPTGSQGAVSPSLLVIKGETMQMT
jgi:hypothetical protein